MKNSNIKKLKELLTSWQFLFGLLLVLLSAFIYYLHYRIFHDAHHIFIYMIGDIAFVPIEVLFVTMILHQLLEKREKRLRLNKMNMAIGIFFSEVGTKLLRYCDSYAQEKKSLKVKCTREQLEELKNYLSPKRGFLLSLLGNPNLLEHETFTDLLWAVFHLIEELDFREDLSKIKDDDVIHLENDINRAYKVLVQEWDTYLKHLGKSYPYLHSLAVRRNPIKEA